MNGIDEPRAPWADRKAPMLARIIALGRSIYWEGWRRTSIRAPYGEVSFGSLMFALNLGSFGRPHLHIAIPGLQVFFRLPRWRIFEHLTRGPTDMERRSYGFSWRFGRDWASNEVHWNWGARGRILSLPWGWNKRKGDYRREYLAKDGQWHSHVRFPYSWVDPKDAGPEPLKVSQPYPYLTNSGEFQNDITATAHMERSHMIYRVLGFPVKRVTKFSIDVNFDKEVGSERGSWKGGCTGCGYDMKPGETISETLHRMRRDRSFCR